GGPPAWTLVKNTILILCILLPLFACVAYLTLWERKLIGWMQIRLGPNRVGPIGLLQPIADAIKLMFKELIVPTGANKFLFIFAPMLTLMPALAAWAVIPFGPETVLADINAGLLYVMAITSMGVYGIIIAGWASNSKYAFLGAMRSAAQIVANVILVSALATVMFLGGWAAPVDAPLLGAIPPFAWLFAKIFFMVSLVLWSRATFPRYRYDQIMRLGWKVFIPLTIVWLVVIAVWMQTPWNIW